MQFQHDNGSLRKLSKKDAGTHVIHQWVLTCAHGIVHNFKVCDGKQYKRIFTKVKVQTGLKKFFW